MELDHINPRKYRVVSTCQNIVTEKSLTAISIYKDFKVRVQMDLLFSLLCL